MKRTTWAALLATLTAAVSATVALAMSEVTDRTGLHPGGCGSVLFRGSTQVLGHRCEPAVYEPGHTLGLVTAATAVVLAVLGVVLLFRGLRSRRPVTALDREGIGPEDGSDHERLPSVRDVAVSTAVSEAKLDLAAGRRAIGTHDLLHEEAMRLRELTVLSSDPGTFASMTYAQRLPVLEAELELWIALVGTLAYWGDRDTDRWWTGHLARFGSVPPLNGSTLAVSSLGAPAVAALYAGGTAAAAAGRWDLVAELITGISVRGPFSDSTAPVASTFGPSHMYAGSVWPSRDLARLVTPVLAQTVGLDDQPILQAWERFEYLVYVNNTDRLKQDLTCYLARPCPYLQVEDNRAVDRRKMTPTPRSYFTTGPDPIINVLLGHGLLRGDRRMSLLAMDTADSVISEQVIRSEMTTAGSGAGYYAHSERRYPLITETR